MGDSPQRSAEEKVASYRAKYPERVAKLNQIVLPLLGFQQWPKRDISQETLDQVCSPLVDKLIAASWGIED